MGDSRSRRNDEIGSRLSRVTRPDGSTRRRDGGDGRRVSASAKEKRQTHDGRRGGEREEKEGWRERTWKGLVINLGKGKVAKERRRKVERGRHEGILFHFQVRYPQNVPSYLLYTIHTPTT